MYKSFHCWVKRHLKKGSSILELGNGEGTEYLSRWYTMHSVEHDPYWMRYNTHYIKAQIIDGWYSVDVLKKELPKIEYDLLIIDGPPGTIGRFKFIENINLFNIDVPIVIDDTTRKDESLIADYITLKLKTRKGIEFSEQSTSRKFTVIA